MCPFFPTLSNISRKASLHEREWWAALRRLRICILEVYATSEDIQITLSPLLLAIAKKICHVCRLTESKIQKCRQIDESGLTIVRVIGGNGAVPVQVRRSVGSRGAATVVLHGVCGELNTYQSVKTTNFLSSWTGGYGRVLSGAVFTCDMAVLTD